MLHSHGGGVLQDIQADLTVVVDVGMEHLRAMIFIARGIPS